MSRVCTRWVPRSDKCKNILETLNVIQIVDAVLTVSCFLGFEDRFGTITYKEEPIPIGLIKIKFYFT